MDQRAPLLRSAEKKFRRKFTYDVTPEEVAMSFHRRFLLGVQMKEVSKLPSELVLFSITLPAYEIGELACSVASGAGDLLKLGDFLAECEESGQFDGYQAAVGKSEGLLTGVHDTMFVSALTRYGQTGLISLFENNRPLFDLCQEVGRRLVSPDLVGPDERAFIKEDFLVKYGPEFLQEFTRRLVQRGLAIH